MKKKGRGTRRFDPSSEDSFTVSRSRIQGFLDCPRCFYLQNRIAIKTLKTFPFRLNSATDSLLKKTFDEARKKQVPHKYFKDEKINLVPFQHEKMDDWRKRNRGIRYLDQNTNLELYGLVDDNGAEMGSVYGEELNATIEEIENFREKLSTHFEVYDDLAGRNPGGSIG